jgi:2-dehydropantoate 2-reductase
MKVVVLGAGALGSILAGHLARAGEDVTLIARGVRAEYLRENGITITGVAEFNTPCSITTDPQGLSEADVLIVAVKTHDMEAAVSSVAHIEFSSVLSVQNGVHVSERLAEVFGAAKTVGSMAFFSGEVASNGNVRFTVNGGFSVGELPEGISDRVRDLSHLLRDSGVNSVAVANILALQWSKFVAWAGFTPVAVLTRLETYRFLLDPDSALISARIMREVAAVAGERKIPLVDSGVFPVEAVVSGSEAGAVTALNELGAFFESNAPGHRMSALQDLENGGRLEIDETLGYAVAEAHRLGIPAPTLEPCFSLLKGINRYL